MYKNHIESMTKNEILAAHYCKWLRLANNILRRNMLLMTFVIDACSEWWKLRNIIKLDSHQFVVEFVCMNVYVSFPNVFAFNWFLLFVYMREKIWKPIYTRNKWFCLYDRTCKIVCAQRSKLVFPEFLLFVKNYCVA